MPIYEYQCIDCGKTFEEFQSFSDSPVQECPFCKGKVKRLISKSVGFVFKGSGFYCTDYRSSKSGSESSSSSCSSCTSSSCTTCGSSSSSSDAGDSKS